MPLPAGWRDAPSAATRRLRLFAGPADEPRARRPSDAVLLVTCAIALWLLAWAAVPPTRTEQAVITVLDSLPGFLDGLWQLLYDLLALAAIAVAIVAGIRRRGAIVRDVVLAAGAALAVSLVVGRLAEGSWPEAWTALRAAAPPPWFPSARLAMAGAALLTASPHLTLPARRAARWVVGLAGLSAAALGVTTPVGVVAGLLVATIAASVVHLALGSSGGRPRLDDLAGDLAGMGVAVTGLGPPEHPKPGPYVVPGRDGDGQPITVKLYGRDAHDAQLFATLWRKVWYRDPGSPIRVGRLQQVEHEAFVTLLASQTGVLTDRVVTAGTTDGDDAVLVLQPVGQPLAELAAVQGEEGAAQPAEVADRLWVELARLHRAGIAHGQIDDEHVIVSGDRVGFADFRGAAVAPGEARLRTDQAQALVTTVLAGDTDGALAAAHRALGADDLAAVAAFVQLAALGPRLRVQARQARLDLDDLRERAAAVSGIEAPELVQLRRVSVRSLVQLVLLIVAFTALFFGLTGLDLEELVNQLSDATVAWLVVGVVVAQLPRLAQSVSTLGASPVPLPLGPVYALQLAVSYVNLAVPSTAARVAVNVRFFQRHGIPPGSALAVGAIDGFASFVVQGAILLVLVVFGSASLDLDLDSSSAGAAARLLALVVLVVLAGLLAILAVRPWRQRVLGFLGRMAREALSAVRGLHSPRRLGMLVGGSLASEVLFACALGAFARALGYDVGLGELLLINVSVSLLAGLVPVPGGIGVVEGGLAFGLVRAGLPEEAAFAAALAYRLATFYLPPVWGYFAFRWLERSKHL